MARDYLNAKPTAMRRSDRAMDEAWIKTLLHQAPYGSTATVHDGQPYIHSSNFAFDEDNKRIYTHSAKVGRTPANIDAHEKVSFSVSKMGRLLPADKALDFSVEFSGVIVFGRARRVGTKDEAIHGLKLIMAKYAPHLEYGKDYSGISDEDLKRTGVFCIDIDSWTGKQKKVEEDFVGAYEYDDITETLSGDAQSLCLGQLSASRPQRAPSACAPGAFLFSRFLPLPEHDS